MATAGAPTVAAGPASAVVARRHSLAGRLHPLTTPGRLRLASIALVLAVMVLGVVGVRAATERRDATNTIGRDATPLLVGAKDLYVTLADADAAASTAFLQAGLEPPELRARYLTDIEAAGRQVVNVAGEPNLSEAAAQAVATLNEKLPRYAGLVEAARTNSRLGFPVGEAYLRRASDVMRTSVLPAAESIYEDAARHLYRGYRSGTSRRASVGILVGGGVVVMLLLITQLLVTRRTRRLVNVGLLGATMLVVALGVVALAVFDAQQDALVRSQREGSDQLLALSTARILALRSLSDENLDLIKRGTDSAHRRDFDLVTARIGGSDGRGGLLGVASQLARRTATQHRIDALTRQYGDYLAVHRRVRQLAANSEYPGAIELAVNDQADAEAALDKAFEDEVRAARQRLDSHADDARHALRMVTLTIVVLAVLAAAFTLIGLQVRIREYR
jgi:hypothetical protein